MRSAGFQAVDGGAYDVAILGAGISGARLFHELAARGFRVLLVDRGDFAGGTSQASGMMIWGGLLYLKDLDFRTVMKLSRSRDEMIERLPAKVRVESMAYLPDRDHPRNRHLVRAGMALYWLLGSRKRKFPRHETEFSERAILNDGRFKSAITFEEAFLNVSDCRFALEWVLSSLRDGAVALNHCEPENMTYDGSGKRWHIDLRDRLLGGEASVSAKFIVNTAGIWTDGLNERMGIASPFRHELSKGVYIAIKRPAGLERVLIFDTGKHGDTFTVVPWGPVAMCGPTETSVDRIPDGLNASVEDVRLLLDLAGKNLRRAPGAEEIVSLRCGIRPLGVKRGYSKKVHPLELSRKHLIHLDPARRAVSVYGGKLTSCGSMAERITDLISRDLPAVKKPAPAETPRMETRGFADLAEPVPAPEWCRDHEHCHTLEDYLRRRTNIAQWIPRGGLGEGSVHRDELLKIAAVFHPGAEHESVGAYEAMIKERHDQVLAAV